MFAPYVRAGAGLFALTVLFCGAAFGFNKRPKVALVASASSNGVTDCRFTDVQTKLMNTGQFEAVDVFDAEVAIPSLATLLEYDACLCWTNTKPIDHVLWGDTMADYVEAGGGVVVAGMAVMKADEGLSLGGRWEEGYEVIVPKSGVVEGHATSGMITDPDHPIVEGIVKVDGGVFSFRPMALQLTTGSSMLVAWGDGRVLVALGPTRNRVDLGFYPPSKDCASKLWHAQGDLLMANALSFVARTPVETYCTAKTSLVCGPARISATGWSSATSTSGFVIRAQPARKDRTGLMIYSDGGPAAIPFQGGFLCVDPSELRRTVPDNSRGFGACGGVFSIDMNSFASGVLGGNPDPFLLAPGTVVNGQWWGRDSVATGSLLSDGIEYCVGK